MTNIYHFTVPEGEKILREEKNILEFVLEIPEAHTYQLTFNYAASGNKNAICLYLNGDCMGDYIFLQTTEMLCYKAAQFNFGKGKNTVSIQGKYGEINISQVSFEKCDPKGIAPVRDIPRNPKASEEAKRLMKYLSGIYGNKVLTGQHTKTIAQDELWHIQKVTGKLPAICGFEFLGYSPNVNWECSDEECLTEVRENQGTVETALQWAEKYKGIIAYCWHWFSPTGGCNKSFYTENTDFDMKAALQNGTPENAALISDMDAIAEQLKIFRDRHIPILWRPLHEAEGTWFWWGAHGAEACKLLWKTMYERFTEYHSLNNLIWVWNSTGADWYPGDEYVDIISTDYYGPKRNTGSLKCTFDTVDKLNVHTTKMIALAESGPVPNPERAIKSGAPWLWYMTWCGSFCTSEDWTDNQQLIETYQSPYAVTLDQLPELY